VDKIVISGIEVHATIGVYSHEQLITQKLSIDLAFSVDIARAAQHDSLSDTHDYAKVCDAVISFVRQTPCRLLETLAHRLANHLTQQFQLSALELSIVKKPMDMPGVTVAVKISQ
jgi:dihydroneopterin aldolase